MSFPDHPPPFGNGNFWHKRAISNDDADVDPHLEHSQALKNPRNSINNHSHLDPQMNRGPGHIFYKTRMCLKFLNGNCRNGKNCTFAHGAEDLRKPQPNWKEIDGRKENDKSYDDQRSVHSFKTCKKYAKGEECPYGESCIFSHERGATSFDADMDERRESSVICIRPNTNMPLMGSGNGVDQYVNNQNLDAYHVDMKPANWKMKLCSKWEETGYCPFGEKCNFAHGDEDLVMPGDEIDEEVAKLLSYNPIRKPISAPTTTSNNGVKKLNEKWRGPKKINGIYGDWLDGLAPPPMYPKNDT